MLDGFQRAKGLKAEHVEHILKEIELVAPHQKEGVGELLKLWGKGAYELNPVHEFPPISITQFLDDPFYAGSMKDLIWPKVRQSVIDIIDGNYAEAVLCGAIGGGKTSIAQLVNAYVLYYLSSLVNPHKYFDILDKNDIYIVCLNQKQSLAKDVTYAGFRGLIENIPYFQKRFKHNRTIERHMVFPKRIRVTYAAADSNNIMGLDVFSGIIDEINFMAKVEKSKRSNSGEMYDQAAMIYSALTRRVKSRFKNRNKFAGCICSVSSANHPEDFISKRLAQLATQPDPLTYVANRAQWEVMPANLLSKETFLVEIGTELYESRILKKESEARKGAEIIKVPMDYEREFKEDITGALRDFGGRAVRSSNPFFYNRSKVAEVFDRYKEISSKPLFNLDSTTLASMPVISKGYKIPDPDKPRAIHLDLGLTGDACGFSMGYLGDSRSVVRHSKKDRSKDVEIAPEVIYDTAFAIKAEKRKEINFASIRSLIYMLSDYGFNICHISLDNFQSADFKQILRRKGYETATISVEGEESYMSLREAVHEDRIAIPYNETLLKELNGLEHDREKKRVDHTQHSTKDVSDSVCGVYKGLTKLRIAWEGESKQAKTLEERTELERPTIERVQVERA